MTKEGRGVRVFGRVGIGLMLTILFPTACHRPPAANQKKKESSGPVSVQVARVAVRQIQREVESVGTLFPFEEVTISSEIDGRVDRVTADMGDRVTPDQVLVHVSEEEERYKLAEDEAQLRQSLEKLGLRSENEKIKDINQAPEVRRARAELFDAEQRYKRMRNLVDQGIGTRQDLDEAQSKFQSAQAAIESAQHQARNLIQEVERYRAALQLQRKKLRDTSVRAPFAAHVKERLVNVGQFVRMNTPLFVLVKTDPVRLRLEIPERMAPWITNGQNTDVTLEAYPERRFQGKVWRISPTVDQAKRTFIVEALIDNRENLLKPGSYARGRIKSNKVDSTKLIPASAILYVFGANKVFVVDNGVIKAQEVKTGDRFGNDVEIVEGLTAADTIATTQLTRLDSGVKVTIARN
ncbi:MAG: efflux RND transporter periplasmic adaptor subunit [Bryobacteraceae bacterium]